PIGQQFLYRHEAGTSQAVFARGRGPVTAQRTGLHSTVTFDVGGRQWLFVAEPTGAYLVARQSWYPWLALVSVLALTAMLTVYLYANITRNARIALLVAERTVQLRPGQRRATSPTTAPAGLGRSRTDENPSPAGRSGPSGHTR